VNKRRLPNFWKSKGNKKTVLGVWAGGQLKKLGDLGQEIVVMQMSTSS